MTKPAKQMARLGASKGGIARAEKLTAEERSASARDAAEARWGRSVLPATHQGELIIGNTRLDCAVLEGGIRVIAQGTMLTALGRAPSMGRRDRTEHRPPFLSAANLRRFVSPELINLYEPVRYRLSNTGAWSVGYRAEILPLVCEVYLDARKEAVLQPSQQAAADSADMLIRGLARVGIIALVDEATGYQEVRAREELQRILEAYVHAEFRPWVRVFPNDFFEQIYRLQGWAYRPGTSKRTPQVGKLIKHYIYEQLPGGVLDELERINPKTHGHQRARKHHQHLTPNTGNLHLDRQISTVTTLMRIARNLQEFEELFDRAFPPAQQKLPLVIDVPQAEEGD